MVQQISSSNNKALYRRTAKLALPLAGLGLQGIMATYALSFVSKMEFRSLLIQLFYGFTFTIGMEFVARFEHTFLWHSNYLWFIHASHHHVKNVAFGEGPAKSKESKQKVEPSTFELNDVFPAVFAFLAMAIMTWAVSPDKSLIKDMALGAAGGISLYGTSYFIGHDLVAHERGGRSLADFFRKLSPTMARCAEIHQQHHSRRKTSSPDQDPFGPPYGFWLGEQEMKSGKDYTPMPRWCQFLFQFALTGMVYAGWNL